jgi:hypothetical protein
VLPVLAALLSIVDAQRAPGLRENTYTRYDRNSGSGSPPDTFVVFCVVVGLVVCVIFAIHVKRQADGWLDEEISPELCHVPVPASVQHARRLDIDLGRSASLSGVVEALPTAVPGLGLEHLRSLTLRLDYSGRRDGPNSAVDTFSPTLLFRYNAGAREIRYKWVVTHDDETVVDAAGEYRLENITVERVKVRPGVAPSQASSVEAQYIVLRFDKRYTRRYPGPGPRSHAVKYRLCIVRIMSGHRQGEVVAYGRWSVANQVFIDKGFVSGVATAATVEAPGPQPGPHADSDATAANTAVTVCARVERGLCDSIMMMLGHRLEHACDHFYYY